MAVTVDIALAGPFHPNGVTVEFDFSFKAASTSEIKVFRQATDGSLTTINAALYSVTLATDGEGGSVVFSAPPATAGGSLYIEGNPAFTQEAIFTNNGFLPVTINPAIDRSALRDIWLRDRINRSISVSFGEAGFSLPPAAARANDVFTFDAYGAPAMVPKSTFRGDKGDPGGNALAIGAWRDFESITVPVGLDMVITTDTLAAGSATGTASARYKLDPEQTQYTTKMQGFITAATTVNNPVATAQAAMDALQSYWRRKSANGRWFTLAEPEPWSGMFGTPGDGGQDFNNSMSGTDVWANMQAFIDYCVYFAKCKGRINPGTHRLSRGLQHGYGQGGYVGGVFEGAGQMYAGGSTFPGTTFVCDTDQDPILNISGDRDVMWEGVSFVGKMGKFLLTSTIAYPSSAPTAGYSSLDQTAWFDSSLRASQDGTYNPYACVTLGAYDGAKPSSALWVSGGTYGFRTVVRANGNVYSCMIAGTAAVGSGPSATTPTVVDGTVTWRYLGPWDGLDGGLYVAYRGPYRPAWLMDPGPEAYGNIYYGSFCTFRNCYFRGATVGLMMKPGTNPSQDDFLSCERCNFTECSFGFSAGNHQLRSLNMQSCNFGILQCAMTNNTHGVKSGSFKAGHVNACGFGASVDIFRTDSSYGEPLVFTACYSEGQFRLGQVSGSAGYIAGFSPLFNACEWSFSGVNIARGRAPRQLYNSFDGDPNVNETSASGGSGGPVFLNCRINVDGAFGCFVEGAKFINSQIYNYDVGAANPPTAGFPPLYLCAFNNATAGGLILTGLEYRVEDQRLQFASRDLDTGLLAGKVVTVSGYRFGDRSRCIPAMVKTVRALSGVAYEELPVPHEGPYLLSKVSGVPSFVSTDPTELKIVFTGSNQTTHADLNGFGPGSVVLESTTGTVWAVRYYDDATDTLYAVAMNNYKIISGVKSFLFPVSLTVGNFAFLHARNYTPATPLFGDFKSAVTATGTNGSPNLTAVTGTLVPGEALTHANIPAGTTVQSINGNTAIMTANATGAVSGSIVASTTISNVATDHGLGSTITTSLAVGDYLASPVEINWLAPPTAKITTLNAGAPGSIVLDQSANKTRSRVRLAIFRRPTLTNV
jgi:hypothetical protein